MTKTVRVGTGLAVGIGATAAVAAIAIGPGTPDAQAKTTAANVGGGHATKAVDHGRPVILVARALGVPAPVFRYAFSKVTPAAAGSEPDPAQVQRNKDALLSVLGKYGVTNDLLDRASNYYRYSGSQGQVWPTQAAVVKARLVDGRVTSFKVIRGGSGYSSAPSITVAGHPEVHARAKLAFSKDFARNGRVASVTVTR